MMMTANLVGFAIGVEGVKYLWNQLTGSYNGWSQTSANNCVLSYYFSTGLQFLFFACACLFIATHVMFEYRYDSYDFVHSHFL